MTRIIVTPTSNTSWNAARWQAIIGTAGSVVIGGLFLAFGLPIVILFLLLVLAPANVVVLGFVGFSHFRIHEAYTILLPLKLPLVLSAASIAAVAATALRIMRRPDSNRDNWLTAALMLSLVAFAGLTVIGFTDSSDRRALVGVAMLVSAAAFFATYRALDTMSAAPWGVETRLFVAFFIVVTLGVTFAGDPRIASSFWKDEYWKVGTMTLILAWLMRTRADFEVAIWMLIGGGCLIAIVACYNWANGIDLVEGSRVTIGRALFTTPEQLANAIPGQALPGGSKLGDPNDLALVLLHPVGLALATVVTRGLGTRIGWFALTALPLLIIAIVFTQSRGGALGVVAVIGAVGLFFIRSKLVLALIALSGIAAMVVVMDIGSRSSGGLAELEDAGIDRSALERLHAWQAAGSMFATNPITGVGLLNFANEFRAHSPVWTGREMAAHSSWFQVLAETGLPGFLLFVALITALFLAMRRIWRILQRHPADPIYATFCLGLFAGLAGYCASGTFLSQAYNWPLHLEVGCTAALLAAVRRIAQTTPRHLPDVEPALLRLPQVPPITHRGAGHD